MRNKSLFLLLACVCGTIAAVGVSQWMQAQTAGQDKIALVEIFVTTKTIDVGEEITAEKIRLEQWPADRIPEGSTSKLVEIETKFARQRFYSGEPVMPVKLMNDANGTSQTIPKGHSVVSMKADPENAVANLVRPGDRVDVMAYFTKSDMIPETMAKTVLTGVRVFAVDGRTQREENEENTQSAKTISLLINSRDAEAWTYASELGRIRLKLVNPGDYTDHEDGDNDDTGQQFLGWIADHHRAQEEQRRMDAEAAKSTSNASTAVAVHNSEEKSAGFKMLKMSNGKLTEYEWVDGKQVPVVVSESHDGTATAVDVPVAAPTFVTDGNEDYSYLNGDQSPFFVPPTGPTSTAVDANGAESGGDPFTTISEGL